MPDKITINTNPKIIHVTQQSNKIFISSPGPQGSVGEFQISQVPTVSPIINTGSSITLDQIAQYITLDTRYAKITGSVQYSASSGSAQYAKNSASTEQTNFATLSIAGSAVATQSYVNNASVLFAILSSSAQYSSSAGYANLAGTSASLNGFPASSYALKSYVDSASLNSYDLGNTYANSASLNAYNNASALVKTGAWNNTNASVNYATYSGSSNYAITSVLPSDTPPSSPVSSQLWYNTATNRLFVWYVDTDSSQWVEVAGAYTPAFNAISSDIAPNVDNYYSLGSASMRWKSLNLGASTLYITDGITGSAAGLAVSNGVLTINGANQLQVGQLKFVDNTIESTSGSTNIQIGLLSSTANLVSNRNLVLGTGKTLIFPDSTIQTTAYVPGTVDIRTPATGNTLTVDLSTDTYVHQHINSGNLSITLTNPTAGKSVELLLAWGNASGGSISINGISGSNLSNGSNGFAITKQFNSIRLYCIDNTFANTFGVVTIS